jgi:hypothetical protein
MVRATKVGGLRSAAQRDVVGPDETVLPEIKQDRYQFRSKASSLFLSLRRRRTLRGPDGEAIDDVPRSKQDNPLDMVRFEDHHYETTDPEIAELIKSKQGYGLGEQFWSLSDERAAHDIAYEEELRRKIAERPDIAKRVLKPSDDEDFTVPQAT